jgi:hypothetical protein
MKRAGTRVGALLALLSIAGGCGDDDEQAAPPAPPASYGSFTSDAEPGDAQLSGPSVTLRATRIEAERIELEVVGHQLDEVYGLAFRLETSSQGLSLESFAKADGFWSSVDSGALSASKQARPGLSVYGVSARGAVAGAPADDRVLATIVLAREPGTDSGIGFVEARSAVVAATGSALPGVSWIGGQLSN